VGVTPWLLPWEFVNTEKRALNGGEEHSMALSSPLFGSTVLFLRPYSSSVVLGTHRRDAETVP
jgi:hypothetical protein